MIDFRHMQVLNKLRERRIEKIERQVGKLNILLNGLDAALHPDVYAEVERERRDLWLRRSELIKKLPPVYEGEMHQ